MQIKEINIMYIIFFLFQILKMWDPMQQVNCSIINIII